MQALQGAMQARGLPRDPANTDALRRRRMRALRRHDWVVYAKTPLAGPAAVLDYLARYTHRTAIGNERRRWLRLLEHGTGFDKWSPAGLTSVQSCPRRRAGVACDERTTDAVGNSCSPLMLPV